MLSLPKSTEFNRRIPKQKFYENLSVTPELKRAFIEQISVIYWRNKLAATTLNVGQGDNVTELEIFEIKLNQPSLDSKVLQLIDKEVPYHILYLLEHNGEYQAWIGYKEPSLSKADTFKVNSYYHTEWLSLDKLPIRLDGLHMDAIYDNFIRQIAGERLGFDKGNEVGSKSSIKDAIDQDNMRRKLNKQIAALEAKMKSEKQFNLQVKLNTELKLLKKELEELN
ncbi:MULTISPECIES: DUF4391 domain-containing protein [unclassified Dehalobacter]|uniref:DUF4391 domain-containing protein n=1 Tax=unclassified Dehalobacter TaxID=2635733 RepID=UPI0003878AC8|nr:MULTISPECIES: DUF4391 domain-containing protein [unclassified Dehalobacter]EQB22145.1 Methyl-accepting chemotaxis protein [Dehalobacter sp. UNSWDHB]MDJ0304436.1 DUF4391 domain-containing protein [Dehalobacter sp.]